MFKQLSEKYELSETIGSGGMGEVYKALHKGLNRNVAIKMLSSEIMDNEEFKNRFKQEAQIIAKLQHKNIVNVYDIDAYDNKLCIIMEYIEGKSLESLLKKRKKLDINEAIDLIIEIAQALDYAHNKGIIHRDVKPDNIMIDKNGNVKIMDFGIARMVDATLQTQTGMSMGTPKYMSPEQAQGKKVTKTTDIYSLGIILYRLVTGKVPFDADNFVAIAMMHISEKPTSPQYVNPDVDVLLSDIILKCLEKDEINRFQSCKELYEALLKYKENNITQLQRSEFTTDADTIPLDEGVITARPIVIKDKDKEIAVAKNEYRKILFVVVGLLLIILLGYSIFRISGIKKESEPQSVKTKSENLDETKELKPIVSISSGKSLKELIEEWNKVKYSDNIDEKKDVLKELVNYYPVEADSKNWKYLYGELLLQEGLVNDNKETLLDAKKHLEEVMDDFKGTSEYEKIKLLIDKVDSMVAN